LRAPAFGDRSKGFIGIDEYGSQRVLLHHPKADRFGRVWAWQAARRQTSSVSLRLLLYSELNSNGKWDLSRCDASKTGLFLATSA
jgi:hypothetical protein